MPSQHSIEGGTELPESDGGAAADHPYRECMTPETAARFDRMPSDPDLSFEIKLLRTCLAELTGDLIRNGRQIVQTMTVLVRAVQTRLKQAAGENEWFRRLCETADQVLQEKERGDE